MKYFQILNCSKDPFPGEPSSELFCPIPAHKTCLNNLVMAVQSGQQPLHAVIGDIGSGKTTLFFQLQQKLSSEFSDAQVLSASKTWLSSKKAFLGKLAEALGVSQYRNLDDEALLNKLKTVLAKDNKEKRKKSIILIDQAEQIPSYCLELWEDLFVIQINNNTLQFVLFASEIFTKKISLYSNLSQNSNIINLPKKVSFADAKNLLGYYLTNAASPISLDTLVTPIGLYNLYYYSSGNPGKILDLFRLTLSNQISQDRKKAGGVLCRQAAKEIFPKSVQKLDKIKVATMAALSILLLILITTTKPQQGLEQTSIIAQENTQKPTSTTQTTPSAETPPVVSTQKHVVDILQSLQIENKQEKLTKKPTKPPVHQRAPLQKKQKQTPVTKGNTSRPLPDVVPQDLGTITVFEQETLGDMIRRIYGPYSFTPANSKKVLANNPHITNKHMLSIGDKITFPSMGINFSAEAKRVRWIRLVTIKKLQDAYRYLRIYAKGDLKLLMVPSWAEEGTFQFNIILEESFANQKDAESKLDKLSKDLYPTATILKGLNRDFFYFTITDPEKQRTI